MCCIAAASRCATVVGDPDQSSTPWLLILSDLNLIHNYVVYGWRSADITNLGKMQNGKIEATHIAMHWTDLTRFPDFPNVVQIMLEQNYRSAGSILATSLAIISQGEFCRYFKYFLPTLSKIHHGLQKPCIQIINLGLFQCSVRSLQNMMKPLSLHGRSTA
jgi:hypothetical protein